MNIKRVIGVAAIMVAVLSSGQAISAPKPDTLVYKVSVKSSFGNEGTREMYIKGPYFRFDYHSGDTRSGLKMDTTAIKNKDGAFFVPSSHRLIGKYAANSPRHSPMSYIPGPQGDVKAFIKSQGAKKTGVEKVGKISCDVYAYQDKPTKASYKLYVNPKTMTPVQLSQSYPVKDGKVFHRTITYLSYQRGASVADSKFELPKGLLIRPMPAESGVKP